LHPTSTYQIGYKFKTTTMTKNVILLGLLILFAGNGNSQTLKVPFNEKLPHDWENQAVSEINREARHASLMPFDTQEKVIANEFSASPYYKCLNGQWKFNLVTKPAEFNVTKYLKSGKNLLAVHPHIHC